MLNWNKASLQSQPWLVQWTYSTWFIGFTNSLRAVTLLTLLVEEVTEVFPLKC